jgi:inner membrane protein
MSPLTHLLASWIVAAKTTDNLRDRRLVTLAGVVPGLDGLGILLDFAHGANASGKFHYYQEYHHMLTHGLPAALVCSLIMAALANRRWRVFGLSLLTFHLHLFCDLAGSRGPGKADNWAIYYFEPLRIFPIWSWRYQWPMDGWQNRVITIALFLWALSLAVKMGDSFVGVFNRRCDEVFVGVLRKYHEKLWPTAPAGS